MPPTLAALAVTDAEMTVHLDRGYDAEPIRTMLTAWQRWIDERTTAWTNVHRKLVWCPERRAVVSTFWIALSSVLIIGGRLIREAWTCYRWDI